MEHTIVSDRQLRIWRACGVGAWPTGELLAGQLVAVIEVLIAELDREDAPRGAAATRAVAAQAAA